MSKIVEKRQLASLIQALAKTCQTCRLVFRRAQYWYVLVDLHLDWPSINRDILFSPGSVCRSKCNSSDTFHSQGPL